MNAYLSILSILKLFNYCLRDFNPCPMKPSKDSPQKSLSGMLRFAESHFRKIVVLMLMYFIVAYADAQQIWGTTSGGQYGSGVIFMVRPDDAERVVIPFPGGGTNRNGYYSSELDRYGLCRFSGNGKFYTITLAGGASNEGVLLEYDPATGKIDVKVEFNFYSDYGRPTSRLTEYNGKLYGVIDGMGRAIFSFNPATDQFKREASIPASCSDLLLVGNKFYGMTRNGGDQWAGSIFEFDPNTSTYTRLAQLNQQQSGRYPNAGLTYFNGKLYGLTSSGGKYGQGTLIEYDIATHVLEKKIDFKSNINGSTPMNNLTLYNGRLLGVTKSGGSFNQGVLFEYDPATVGLRKVMDFTNATQGRSFQNINGTLYGLSGTGGRLGEGLLYSFDLGTLGYTELYTYGGDAGSLPFGQLVLSEGKLWGMTMKGGLAKSGVIFNYDIDELWYTTPLSFNYFPLGKKPTCLVEFNNEFYGLTAEGGKFGHGVLFKVNPVTHDLSVLHDFKCETCSDDFYPELHPEGGLIVNNGNLYGVTWKQGNTGELFVYYPGLKKYTHVHEFTDFNTGLLPLGNLAVYNGKVYGTTLTGGTYNQGVLFELNPVSLTFQVKLNLEGNLTGTSMRLSTVNKMIYGIARKVDYGSGTLSQYNPDNNTLVTRHQFQRPADAIYGNMALAVKLKKVYGYVYDNTSYHAKVFSFDTETLQYNQISNLPGSISDYEFLVASSNNLYGTLYFSPPFQLELESGAYRYLPEPNPDRFNNYDDNINSMVVKEDFACSSETLVTQVVEFNQGGRKDGQPISADRSDPYNALYRADNFDNANSGIRFTTLGFGGSITLAFDNALCDHPGDDFRVYETSYGNPSFYHNPEQAEVFVSQNGNDWISLGLTSPNAVVNCSAKMDTDFDFTSTGLDWVKYIRVIDVSNPLAKRRGETTCLENGPYAFNAAADGFDLDAIEPISLDANTNARKSPALASHTVDIDGSKTKAVLYPNPVPDELTIDLSQEEEIVITDENIMFEIMDINGKIVHKSVKPWDDTWMIKHNVRELKSGMYIARVKNGNVRRSYKFLKN